MKLDIFVKTLCAAALATGVTTASAQQQFDTYLGQLETHAFPLPLAADNTGRLYYGTLSGPDAAVYVVDDPVGSIGLGINTRDIHAHPFDAGRGFQGLTIDADGNVYASGDTGAAANNNIWKFTRDDSGSQPEFTLDDTFRTNASARTGRHAGITIVSNDGDGLFAAAGLTSGQGSVDFYDLNGNPVGTTLTMPPYLRDITYNSTDNVIYPIRNGGSSPALISGYFTDVDPVAGTATFVDEILIPDGASFTNFGVAAQHGYYYAGLNQIITTDNSTATPISVRVWNISEDGTELTLAYSITETAPGTPFTTSLGDAVVIGDKLFVSNTNANRIYVYGDSSSVNDWSMY